jgi:HCOMODA/2-hydroxy-3-carboxy-muconic semialdehyde decarboxylase
MEDRVTSDAAVVAEVVDANHVLVAKGVLDAYGHVSARHPDDPSRFLLSRNLAPGLVRAEDLQVYDLDSVTDDPRPGYLERFLHAEIYRARSDVQSVVHSHSAAVVPFSISRQPLRAVWHMSAFVGEEVPVFEIRDLEGAASDLLIRSPQLGAGLAATLGGSAVALMRGHGSVAVGGSVSEAVFRAVFTELNARVQAASIGLGAEYTALTAGEVQAATESNRGQIPRAWEIWRSEVRSRS